MRRSLIGLIIIVLLAVVFNYMHIWYRRARSVRKVAQILSSEMIQSFNRVEYSENQNGIPRFKLSAQGVLETRQGISYLQGIEANDFNPDGSPHNEIRSQKAQYNREHKIADFSGDVRLFFGKGVELRTNSLHYDINAKVGTTRDKLQIISNTANGSARGIRFDQNQQSMDLSSEVDLVMVAEKPESGSSGEAERFHALSDRAYCADQMQRIVFQGNARVESKSNVLSGDSIEAILAPEGKKITSLISTGNAAYRSGDSNEIQTLRGDRMDFGIGESKTLEKISVVGQAVFSSASPEGEEVLQGGEIDMAFDAATKLPNQVQGRNGVLFNRKRGGEQMKVSGNQLTATFLPGTKNLESIHVQKQASMHVEGNASAVRNDLQAEEIRMSFRQLNERTVLEKLRAEGSARWLSTPPPDRAAVRPEPARTLTASSLEMVYSRVGDSFESGNASGSVVISESRNATDAGSQTRRMLADHAQFHFFPGNNQLRDMDADGHVQVIQEKKKGSGENSAVDNFRTASEKLKVIFALQENESAVESMAQWGNFRYEDASMSATGGRCDYDAKKAMLTLRDSPRISDEMNSTTGKWVEYEQKHGVLAVHEQVRSLLSAQKGKESFFNPSSSSSPAIVTADEMQYWTADRRARYTGKVQLLSENGQLQTGKLDIIEGGETVEAQNAVRHFIPETAESKTPGRTDKVKDAQNREGRAMLIRSSSMKYLRGSNTITYLGAVTAHSGDIDISSESLVVVIAGEGGSVEHATAQGKVQIRQGSRECKGEKADYFLSPRKFVLVGNPAEVYDPEKGRSFAARLTSFIADDRILLENH